MSGDGDTCTGRWRAAILLGASVAWLIGARPSHASSLSGQWETVVVVAAGVVVAVVFTLAIKMLLWPGERAPDHIKRAILDDSAERSSGKG